MEGLEASVASSTHLERTSRIDAEFFQKRFLRSAVLVERWHRSSVAELAHVSDGNHFSISDDFVETGVPYYRGQDVTGRFFIETASPIHITQEAYNRKYMRRSYLRRGDVLLSIIGTIGELSLVASDRPATCSCKLAILRPRTVSPEFLAIYLRSEHGQNQIERLTRGAVQKGLILEDMDQLWVPAVSAEFETRVAEIVHCARRARDRFEAKKEEAENTLLARLGIADWAPPEALSYTARASEARTAERMDSEHFKEKFRAAESQLVAAGANSFVPLGELLSYLTNGHTPLHHDLTIGEVPFITAEHVGDFTIDYQSKKRILTSHHRGELSRTALRFGDVLMTIKGRVGNSALVECPGVVANINQDVALLRFKDDAPLVWYILAFINSSFGKLEVEKWSTGAINPFLGLYNVRKIRIPLFDNQFMEDVGRQAMENVQSALAEHEQAQYLLDATKRAVEIAIEDGEAIAMTFLDRVEGAD